MQQKITRAQLVARFKQKQLEQMPESFKQLCQEYPQAFRGISQNPLQPRPIRGFNQEILVYSSNTATPLKTAGVYQSGGGDMFRFDEQQILTPQPKQSSAFEWSQQHLQTVKKEAIFSRSQAGQANHLVKRMWYYVDDYQMVQGPFNSLQMDSWYLKGYFDEIVRIGFRADNSENFFRIYQLKTFKHQNEVLKFLRKKSCPPVMTKVQDIVVVQVQKPVIVNETPKIKMPPIKPKKK